MLLWLVRLFCVLVLVATFPWLVPLWILLKLGDR